MFKQVTKVIQSIAKTIEKFLNSKTGTKFAGKFAKNIAPGIAKAAPIIGLMTSLDEIPGFKELVKANYDVNDKIYNAIIKTPISKIPGIGKDLSEFLETVKDNTGIGNPIPIGRVPVPKQGAKIMGWYNNPNWYTNLGTHTEFKIPLVYPENLPLPFGDGVDRVSLAIINLVYNPWSAPWQRNQRLSEALDLMKATRGLSGSLPYNQVNLANYLDFAAYFINEYGRLKFALKSMNYFSLAKSSLPRYLINAIGFDYDDMLQNKPQFQSLLVNLHNFIQNNVPLSGDIFNKIFHSWDAMIPDTDDIKVAMLYKTNLVCMTNQGNKVWNACFSNNEEASFTPQSKFVDYAAAMQECLTTYLNTQVYSSIRGDMIGAFGTAVAWSDPNLKDVEKYNINIIAVKDELYLTAIQNATILGSRGFVKANNGNNTIVSVLNSNSFTFTQIDSALESIPQKPWRLRVQGAIQLAAEATDEEISWPANDGFTGAIGVSIDADFSEGLTTETPVISNKYTLSEGESLEIMQFKSWMYNMSVDREETEVIVKQDFNTHEFAVATIDVIHYNSQGQVETIPFENICAPVNLSYTPLQLLGRSIRLCQLWSQMDYGPRLVITQDASGHTGGRANSAIMLDYNIMGTISKSAFDISIAYSTYSLYALALNVGNRIIHNIADVYTSKSKTYTKANRNNR